MLAKSLVTNLSVRCMANRHEDGRVALDSVLGHINQRRDIYSGQTLKNQFLDMKAFHLNLTGDLGMQRSPFGGEAAQHREQLFFQLALNAQQVYFSAYSIPDFAPLV